MPGYITQRGFTLNICLEMRISFFLTIKAPILTAADDIHEYFFFHCFSEKIRLDVANEFSARQRIHMKHQALFSLKYKSEKSLVSSAAIFVWRFKS